MVGDLVTDAFRTTPIAVLTSRGTVRTRKPVSASCQQYPKGSPAEWIRDGHQVASVSCITCRHHSGDVGIEEFPAGRSWSEVGRLMLCKACGTPSVVHIPNWLHHLDHVTPHSERRRQEQ